VKLYQQHFERVNYNIHTRQVKKDSLDVAKDQTNWGPPIKYNTLFLANVDPPVTLCHTSSDTPKGTSHISDPRSFLVGLVQKPGRKPYVQILSQLFAGFCLGVLSGVFCLEGFVRGRFCPFPLFQNTSVTTES